MKIDKRFRLEKAVSKNDDPMDIKTKVFISRETAIVTDGRIIGFIPIEIEEKDAVRVLVDPYVFIEARKFAKEAESDFLVMQLNGEDENGKVIFKNGITIPYQLEKAELELIPPDYSAVIPTDKPKFSIAIDLTQSQLNKLSAALGQRLLKLEYYGPKQVMRITPLVTSTKEEGFIAAYNSNE